MEFIEGMGREAGRRIGEMVLKIVVEHKPLVGDAAIEAEAEHKRHWADFNARHAADLREFCTDREVWEEKTVARLLSGRRLGEQVNTERGQCGTSE